jgi:REP element-mobilizing transposase RayT
MPQSFVCLNCHLIFSTKYREPLLAPDWSPRLYQYIGGTLRAKESVLLAAGGMPDHIHLAVSLARQATIADVMRDIKANSSRWIHETFEKLRGFAWQTGYAAFSVSQSNLAEVKQYIANQSEHHRVRTFQEEFIMFLRRHGVQHDENHVWD